MGGGHYFELRGKWLSRPGSEMTSFWKIAAPVTCVADICDAAILWPVYKENAIERKLAEDARVRAEQGDAKAQFKLASSITRAKESRRTTPRLSAGHAKP